MVTKNDKQQRWSRKREITEKRRQKKNKNVNGYKNNNQHITLVKNSGQIKVTKGEGATINNQ